jgi:hypothetical protein
VRYAYLVGRLRNRQITMEEATELFAIMQSMIQSSEAARAAMARVPPPPPMASPGIPRAPPVPGTAGMSGDDMLLVGLIGMGAGAGLLAAMTKRFQEAAPFDGMTPPPRSNAVSPARKG